MNNKFCIYCQWYLVKGHDNYLCVRPPYYGKVNLVSGKIDILVERKCEEERRIENTQIINKTNTGFTTTQACGENGKFYLKRESK